MLIVKLGGSVIQEELTHINPKVFQCVDKLMKLDRKIVIVTGGGKLSRFFQKALVESGHDFEDNLHWVGTKAVNIQSEFVRSLFPVEKTFPVLINSQEMLDRAVKEVESYDYFACGGWQIGHSSDFDAVKSAVNFNSKVVLRISDIDYVYDTDPRKNENAKIIKQASWDEYLNAIGNPEKHIPGASYPVDPVAARAARESNLKFYFTSLNKFVSMGMLDFENFEGTIIG